MIIFTKEHGIKEFESLKIENINYETDRLTINFILEEDVVLTRQPELSTIPITRVFKYNRIKRKIEDAYEVNNFELKEYLYDKIIEGLNNSPKVFSLDKCINDAVYSDELKTILEPEEAL